MQKVSVLSLFDGISAGRLALQRAGIQVDKYYASEIDKYAIQVSQKNWPDIVQIGDVTKVKVVDLGEIDLVLAGFPCQSHSTAGKQGGFSDPRGQLFFDALRILNELKQKNPNIKFLFENVKMKKESADLISKELGVEAIVINSSLLSAQNRVRMYWSNIPDLSQPEDSGIKLQDVIENGYVDREKAYCIDANYSKGGNPAQYFDKSRRQLVFQSKDQLSKYAQERIDERKGQKTGVAYNWYNDRIINDKSPALISNPGCWSAAGGVVVLDTPYRKLSVEECEVLQNFPKSYTTGISDTQRYKCIGNSWTVDVIAHIFKGLKTLDTLPQIQ